MTKEEIYPQIWDEPDEGLLREYREAFTALWQFISEPAALRHAVVVEIS